MNNKTVFLVDLDNTLIDTEKFRDAFIEDAESFPFEKHFFPFYKNLLNILHGLGEVFIFSGGEETFQMAKITRAGIDQIIDPDHIIIVPDKISSFETIIPRFKDKEITFIDDRADFLNLALKIDPKIKCIWVRYGKYKDDQIGSKKFELITNSLEQILDYFYPYKINEGLTEKQISKLITYTKDDPEIKKYTSDVTRFKDRKSFDEWLVESRTIYSLTDSDDNLLGIIWFSQKQLPEENYLERLDKNQYETTFAIRMYGTARGKGLAKKFMNDVFTKYTTSHSAKIWLLTSADNIPAKKLYENFGFKTVTKPDKEGKIVMIYG